jgi:phosphate transport system substrate-binding protein
MRLRTIVFGLVLALAGLSHLALAQEKDLATYKPTNGVSGSIKSVGSDTMVTTMLKWSEGFKKAYPNIAIEVEDKGSSGAVPALTAGTANFGPMSRKCKPEEIADFEKKYGYKPTQLPVCIDMVVVFVNKDCPLEKLTFEQVDAIFSSTRKLGAKKDIVTWGDLGLKGEWAAQPISLYGRNSSSGTYEYVKNEVLGKGDYKSSVKEQPGSSGVVQAVGVDKFGIGYSGVGYLTPDVKAVSLAKKADEFIEPTPENGMVFKYPLARPLFLTLNHKPKSELDPLRREFIKFVYSKEGQALAADAKVLPVPAKVAAKGLEEVGIK